MSRTSLTHALNSYFQQPLKDPVDQSLKNLDELRAQSNYFGRKVCLAYEPTTGWKVVELSFLQRVFRVLGVVYQNTRYRCLAQQIDQEIEDLPYYTKWFLQDFSDKTKVSKFLLEHSSLFELLDFIHRRNQPAA